jgi:hypothetical protein
MNDRLVHLVSVEAGAVALGFTYPRGNRFPETPGLMAVSRDGTSWSLANDSLGDLAGPSERQAGGPMAVAGDMLVAVGFSSAGGTATEAAVWILPLNDGLWADTR